MPLSSLQKYKPWYFATRIVSQLAIILSWRYLRRMLRFNALRRIMLHLGPCGLWCRLVLLLTTAIQICYGSISCGKCVSMNTAGPQSHATRTKFGPLLIFLDRIFKNFAEISCIFENLITKKNDFFKPNFQKLLWNLAGFWKVGRKKFLPKYLSK